MITAMMVSITTVRRIPEPDGLGSLISLFDSVRHVAVGDNAIVNLRRLVKGVIGRR